MKKNIFILEDQTSCLTRLEQLVHSVMPEHNIIVARDLKSAQNTDTSECVMGFIDLGLPDGKSFDYITWHLAQYPNTPLIITTFYDDNESIFRAMSLGVSGYLLKSDSDELLTNALCGILMGQVPISPYIAKQMINRLVRPRAEESSQQQHSPLESLSSRELEVLKLISKGLLTKQVAHELSLSEHTVNDVIKRIYKKCHVHNRIEAQKLAVEHNLI